MFSNRIRSNKFQRLLLIAVMLISVSLVEYSSAPAQAQEGGTPIGLSLVTEALVAPVDLDSDGSGRLFVVDRPGVIYAVDGMGGAVAEPFLDIRDRIVELNPEFDERGLLSMALHPDFANNGRFFVFYTAPPRPEAPVGYTNTNILSEFTLSTDTNTVDPASERILLMVDHPEPNHNGGDMAFGPDGFLYLSLGDGGGGNDEGLGHTEGIGNAQDLTNMHGKILRLDIDSGDPYGIPADNPFVDQANALPEIFAYGLRNPWRIDFDNSGNLYVSDAGQELYEEVNLVMAGGNYGWRLMEGAHCFDPANPAVPPETCEQTGPNGDSLINPVIEFDHMLGVVVVGGDLYEGSAMAELNGQFIFGVWTEGHREANGRLFAAQPAGTDSMWSFEELVFAGEQTGEEGGVTSQEGGEGAEGAEEQEVEEPTTGIYILSVEADVNGELYILTTRSQGLTGTTGQVWALGPADGQAPVAGEGEPSPAGAEGVAPNPSLVIDNQSLAADGTVTIPSVVSPGPGWIMIHADDRGYYGAPIGSAPVPAGVSTNVVVPIDTANATMTLHAMLHADAGTQGTLEFPGPDVPVTSSMGRVLSVPFLLLPTDPNQPLTISVALDEFYAMMPAKLPAGMATFSVTNHGSHPHNIEIEGEGIEMKLFETDLQPGETRTVQAEIPPGTYEVYCPVDDHADFGMRYIVPVEAIAPPAGGETSTEPTQAPADDQGTAPEATEAAQAEPEATAPLVVQDQEIGADGTVIIPSVTVDAPAWVVVHADASGTPGTVIGWVLIQAGTTENVAVPIQGEDVTAVLHAMLHIDAGELGTYEFPGADVPLMDANNQMITLPFNVTVSE